jgi:hypothetical protein
MCEMCFVVVFMTVFGLECGFVLGSAEKSGTVTMLKVFAIIFFLTTVKE